MAVDFDALRAARRAEREKLIEDLNRAGFDGEKMRFAFVPDDSCYCGCPDGPCEHEFRGWRAFADGMGGESFCHKCSLGAMAHTLAKSG